MPPVVLTTNVLDSQTLLIRPATLDSNLLRILQLRLGFVLLIILLRTKRPPIFVTKPPPPPHSPEKKHQFVPLLIKKPPLHHFVTTPPPKSAPTLTNPPCPFSCQKIPICTNSYQNKKRPFAPFLYQETPHKLWGVFWKEKKRDFLVRIWGFFW